MEFEVRVSSKPYDASYLVFPTYLHTSCSFSWSQAFQLPLLDLCRGKNGLVLDEMSKVYVEELAIASAAARGEHTWAKGEGDHVGTKQEVEDVNLRGNHSLLLSSKRKRESDQ